MKFDTIYVVGLGGVGSQILDPLARWMTYHDGPKRLVLIDGDDYERKNAERQVFDDLGNKADQSVARLAVRYPELSIEAVPRFLTEGNAYVYIKEEACVLSCVGVHASVKVLNDHCATLRDAVLINGANGFDDGIVQLYIREEGADVTPPLTYLHPEIANPADANPAGMTCEERSRSGGPQLVLANLLVAAEMLACLYMAAKLGAKYSEKHFDLKTGASRAILRKEETR